MPYPAITKMLDQEGTSFYRHNRRWQPKNLLPVYYAKRFWDDVTARWALLEAVLPETQGLDRSFKYTAIYKNLRFVVRRMKFAWLHDNLIFMAALSEFYQGYGQILQMLKTDQARGLVPNP